MHPAASQLELQYLADRDIGKVTWFQEMVAQVPKS
jgi:hypothetical protein